MLGEALSADPGHRGPRIDCGHGHEAVFAGYREKVIDTVLGPVTLRRAWYHCAECGHGLAPRDAELGVAGASMSPGLAAMNDLAAAAGPFAGAARLLEELAGVRLTARRVERAAEASGTAVAAAGRGRAALIASRKLVPAPAVPAAGQALRRHRRHRRPDDRAGRPPDGTARARTAAPAPAKSSSASSSPRTSSTRTATRSATGPPPASSPPSSPPPRSGTWCGPRASAAARTTSASSPSSATAPPGSGASPPPSSRRPPRSSTSTTPASTCTPSPGPWNSCCCDRKDEWLAARLEDLDYGDIDGIEAAVRKYPLEGVKRDEVDKELGYFLNNAPRMRYHWFRSRGLFVGSGVVEASCKTVVGQRLKQAGMHWTVAGADAIIALRCREASSQWEAICNHRHNQTEAA